MDGQEHGKGKLELREALAAGFLMMMSNLTVFTECAALEGGKVNTSRGADVRQGLCRYGGQRGKWCLGEMTRGP